MQPICRVFIMSTMLGYTIVQSVIYTIALKKILDLVDPLMKKFIMFVFNKAFVYKGVILLFDLWFTVLLINVANISIRFSVSTTIYCVVKGSLKKLHFHGYGCSVYDLETNEMH